MSGVNSNVAKGLSNIAHRSSFTSDTIAAYFFSKSLSSNERQVIEEARTPSGDNAIILNSFSGTYPGVNSYTACGNLGSFPTATATMALRVYPITGAAYRTALCNRVSSNAFALHVSGTNTNKWAYTWQSLVTPTWDEQYGNIYYNQWQDVILIVTPTGMRMYSGVVDGALSTNTNAYSHTAMYVFDNMTIANDSLPASPYSRGLNCRISAVAVYPNYAFTLEDANNWHDNPRSMFSIANNVWTHSEGSGTTIFDQKQKRNGTVTNGGGSFWSNRQDNFHFNLANGFSSNYSCGLNGAPLATSFIPSSVAGRIEFSFVYVASGSNQMFFGVRSAANDGSLSLWASAANNLIVDFKNGAACINQAAYFEDGKLYSGFVSWAGNGVTVSINDDVFTTSVVGGSYSIIYPIYLGARNSYGTEDNRCQSYIIDFKLYDSSDVLYDPLMALTSGIARVGRSNKEIDLYIASGQSNMVGYGATASSYTPTLGTSYDINISTMSFTTLSDPTGYGVSASATGSMLPSFCTQYNTATGRTVAIIKSAKGASSQHYLADSGAGNWDDIGTLYAKAVSDTYKAIGYLRNRGYIVTLKGLLWSQGETDAGNILSAVITKAQYKAAALNMFQKFRAEFGNIEIIIQRTGRPLSADHSGYVQLRAAQDELAAENAYIHIGHTNAVNFPSESKMIDEFHYTTAGYDEIGTALAIKASEYTTGETFYPFPYAGRRGFNRSENTFDMTNSGAYTWAADFAVATGESIPSDYVYGDILNTDYFSKKVVNDVERKFKVKYKPPPFTPASLTNLLIWCTAKDASTLVGNPISQWSDKSGNNYHLTQSTEILKPIPVTNGVKFDSPGSNSYLNIPAAVSESEQADIFMVVTTPAALAGSSPIGFGFLCGNEIFAPAIQLCIGYNLTTFRAFDNYGNGTVAFSWPLNTTKQCRLYIDPTKEVQVSGDSTGTLSALYSFGDLEGVYFNRLGTALHLDGEEFYQAGTIREIIILGEQATAQEEADIKQYFVDEWGVA